MRVVIRLLPFVKRYWGWMLLSFLCMLVGTLAGLVVPRTLGQGIDIVLHSGQKSSVIMAAVIIVAAAVIRGIAAYGNRYLTQVVSQQVSYDMRNTMYDHIQRLSFAYYDKAQTGQLVSRATVDVEAVRMFLSEGLLGIVQLVFLTAGIGVVLLITNWHAGLLTMAFFLPIAYITVVISRRLRPLWLKVQQLMGTMNNTLQESLMGIRVVKAFSRQKEEIRKFTVDADKLYEAQVSAARLTAFNMPLMVFMMSIPVALVLWYGGRQVMEGNLTIGGVTAFILYVGMLSMPIQRLGMIANMYSRTVSAGQRILEILDTQSVVKEKPGAIELSRLKGAVSFEAVSFGYNNISPALNDITFKVQPGELVALLGGSGSGKSTLVNLISRFYDVTSGKVSVDGIDIRDVSLGSLRHNVGVAQQDVFLFSSTIKSNIAYGVPDADMTKITIAAKAAQIHDFIMGLPDGYETWVGERGLTLSGGEKQRIVIARALLMNPSILVLDDSMSSVDSETERLIRLALEQLIKNRTTFIITHRLPIIRNADLIIMLQDGRIEEMGKHSELMLKRGLYYRTYTAQQATTADQWKDSGEE